MEQEANCGNSCRADGGVSCCKVEALVSIDERGQMVLPKELREKVAEELRKESDALSAAYRSTKLLRIRTSSEARIGIARVSEQLLRDYGARSGGHVMIRHKDHETKMQVEARSELDPQEIQVNRSDLDKLGAQEGVRLDVRFPK